MSITFICLQSEKNESEKHFIKTAIMPYVLRLNTNVFSDTSMYVCMDSSHLVLEMFPGCCSIKVIDVAMK